MAKFRCRGCAEYFPPDQAHATIATLGRVCSEGCLRTVRERGKQRRARRRRDGEKGSLPIETRRRVRARDLDRCRLCGTGVALHCHHITYRSQGGPDEDWNLITLCVECHPKVHADKRRFQPLCRAYIWLLCVEHRQFSLLQIERTLRHG